MKNISITPMIILALAVSGCGPQPISHMSTSSKFSSSGTNFDPSGDGSGTDDPTPTPSTTPTVGTGALYAYTIQGIGYTTVQTVTVSAGTVLKLKFAPGQQNSTVAGTGYTPIYSMLGVYITVGSSTQSTPMMANGLYAMAQNSGTMDFSAAAASATGCSASDTTCRGNVTVTISKPNYDYWCLQFFAYCPWNHVSDTHPWNGNLTIQTDDTIAL